MIALRVTVPIACFRKGFAREFWETEELPPPATCYGFLLSLVGEQDRRRHVGVRVCPALLGRPDRSAGPVEVQSRLDRRGSALLDQPERSAVLRTLWRVKKLPLGSPGNTRPDYQEILTNVRLAIWLDSTEEIGTGPTLEDRVHTALDHPERINRFGGLSLGESTHLVDEVTRLSVAPGDRARAYLLNDRGRLSLPVWVDHVGSAKTRYVSGDLVETDVSAPNRDRMPRIEPLS